MKQHASGVGLRARLTPWTAALVHPGVRTFEELQRQARWAPVVAGVCLLSVVQAVAVAILVLGPAASQGFSSLPVGPKLRVPIAPGWLIFAALFGSIVQFFAFSWVLLLSARAVGGRGGFLPQSYVLALFWVPLMIADALASLFGVAGSVAGLLLRLYALVLIVPALAAVHALSLRRAALALGALVVLGLALGLIVLVLFSSQLSGFVK